MTNVADTEGIGRGQGRSGRPDPGGAREYLTVGSLFSGIGGFDLGLERAGMRTVWFCEQDPYCQRVLNRHWPGVKCYPDVARLKSRDVFRLHGFGQPVQRVDVLCGGFPCQDLTSPAAEQGSTGNARVFGASTPDSFANYDPDTSSWKTSQLSLLEDWTAYSGTWPRAGMTRNGTAYRLQPLAPLTAATGSGSWPTPNARDHKDTGDNTDYQRIAARSKLAGVVQVRETPSASTANSRPSTGPTNTKVLAAQRRRSVANPEVQPAARTPG